jgi:GYF domain 2
MANYTIIGGDGKQYGPITEGEIRKWIAEGRLNAQSLAKSESDAEFRPCRAAQHCARASCECRRSPGSAGQGPCACDRFNHFGCD